MKFLNLLFISLLLLLFSCQQKATYEKRSNGVVLSMSEGHMGIYPVAENAVRIQFVKDTLEKLPELIFTNNIQVPDFEVSQSFKTISLSTSEIRVMVDRKKGSITYADKNGEVFLSETGGARVLLPDTIMGEPCYFAEQSFESPDNEYIFGLGQFQDGQYNLKGVTRRLTQVNSQIALPFIYSSKGYGLLWHQYGLTDFNPADNYIPLEKQEQSEGGEEMVEVTTTAGTQKVSRNQSLYKGKFTVVENGMYSVFLDLGDMGDRHFVSINGKPVLDQSNVWLPPTAGALVELEAGEHEVSIICSSNNQPTLSWDRRDNITTFRSPVSKKLDYVVFAGSADEVIASYRNLSGDAPMFPKWAYGFWQCRERYTSSQHLVETVKEFRKRKLPMDVIVQDWQYWGNRGWGVPQFDETNYPEPEKFIQEIHDLNAHFNISIWSNPDKNSELGKKYVENNRFIPSTKWLDYFNPKTREEYWNTLKENMFDYGVDSWWMDAVEPENDALKGEMTHAGPGDFYRLVYPLMVSKAVYNGQRETSSEKRVCILTRSAFLGQQRYGIINWSGDIGGNWDTYQRQIVAGLNYSLTGLPYWTTDIGGFFRPGMAQYTSENFRELLIRWFQWGAFNPIFRNHGYMSETEPWKYGEKVESNVREILNLRYRLLPYIYSEAWQITENGSTMMRPLVMDFSEDEEALKQPYQYLFGPSILVSPVIERGVTTQDVYLPKNTGWFNFWDNQAFEGGNLVKVDTPIDKIPLFVKAGSILPVGPKVQYSSEKEWDELEIRIYSGADGSFTLYEDEGDNYNYENGGYATISFNWDDNENALTIGKQNGSYPGKLGNRNFKIVVIGKNDKVDHKEIEYSGKEVTIKL